MREEGATYVWVKADIYQNSITGPKTGGNLLTLIAINLERYKTTIISTIKNFITITLKRI